MRTKPSLRTREGSRHLDGRFAAYLTAAGAVGTVMASEARAVIVSDSSVQPFGINEEVSIDFNGDTQIDYQIDHDRVDLGGGNLVDYLQIDKNDSTAQVIRWRFLEFSKHFLGMEIRSTTRLKPSM